jgi:glycine C-acetyltransferase/8-amino-7-oxononanoate synthase
MDFIEQELNKLKEEGTFRKLKVPKNVINFCSNDYLGLSKHPKVIERAASILKKYGVGAGASRLVSGNFDVHEELESKIAEYENTQASIVFPTGYMANLGTIQALVGAGDAVIIDRLDHASIVDGARLSGAKMLVYPHKNIDALEKILKKASSFKRILIVTDHIFSMDGDIAPVNGLAALADKYDAMLMVDVAHSTGVLDVDVLPKYRKNLIIMGTLSKAIGSLGGFVAGSSGLIDYLRNKARAYIYTTALPPAIAAASVASFEIMMKEPELKKKLWDNVKYLKRKLEELDLDIMGSQTQIMPIMVGDSKKAVEMSEDIYKQGILLTAIRPPTVPKGTARLRLTVSASHSGEDIDKLISVLGQLEAGK